MISTQTKPHSSSFWLYIGKVTGQVKQYIQTCRLPQAPLGQVRPGNANKDPQLLGQLTHQATKLREVIQTNSPLSFQGQVRQQVRRGIQHRQLQISPGSLGQVSQIYASRNGLHSPSLHSQALPLLWTVNSYYNCCHTCAWLCCVQHWYLCGHLGKGYYNLCTFQEYCLLTTPKVAFFSAVQHHIQPVQHRITSYTLPLALFLNH